jgi:drug/metabolite transporter (DMT)-like permease
MFVYGFVLFTTGKLSHFEELSSVPSLFQYLAIVANVIVLGVYYLYKNKVLPERDIQRRFPLYIICWALNEVVVLWGFLAVFMTNDGNGFLYVVNLAIALTGNILTFPKK